MTEEKPKRRLWKILTIVAAFAATFIWSLVEDEAKNEIKESGLPGKALAWILDFLGSPFPVWAVLLLAFTAFYFREQIRRWLVGHSPDQLLPKAKKRKLPDWAKKYCQDAWGPMIYEWSWKRNADPEWIEDGIENVRAFCPKCNYRMEFGIGAAQCRKTGCRLTVPYLGDITQPGDNEHMLKSQIEGHIRNDTWKDAPGRIELLKSVHRHEEA